MSTSPFLAGPIADGVLDVRDAVALLDREVELIRKSRSEWAKSQLAEQISQEIEGVGGMLNAGNNSMRQAPCLNQPFSAPRRLDPSSLREPGNSS